MDNFKLNFLSRGQLESLSLDKIFLPLFKILPCYEVFFGNFIFAIIARMFCEIILNVIGRSPNTFERLWKIFGRPAALPLRR